MLSWPHFSWATLFIRPIFYTMSYRIGLCVVVGVYVCVLCCEAEPIEMAFVGYLPPKHYCRLTVYHCGLKNCGELQF